MFPLSPKKFARAFLSILKKSLGRFMFLRGIVALESQSTNRHLDKCFLYLRKKLPCVSPKRDAQIDVQFAPFQLQLGTVPKRLRQLRVKPLEVFVPLSGSLF